MADSSLNIRLSDYFGFDTSLAVFEQSERHPRFPRTQHRHQHFPMHLLTTTSIEHLAAMRQVDVIDSRRFRPTVVIETREGSGFVENDWVGRRMRLGVINLTARSETKRCGVTFISQPGLEDDPEILRNILRHNRRNFGVYCSIENTGTIQLGDELFIDD